MIEPGHIDELVTATKAGSLVWRLRDGGDAEAGDAIFRYVLDSNGGTLYRIGRNPFDRETGGVSRTNELSIKRVLAPVVNSVVLPAIAPPSAPSKRSSKRTPRSPKRTPRTSPPGLKEAMPTITEAAKHGRVEDEQLELIVERTRRGDPA